MRFVILVATLLFSASLLAQDEFETADVGFRGFNSHIAIEPLTEEGLMAYKFFLRDNNTNKSAAISTCTYLENALVNESHQINDPSVKADFGWMFIRSGYSSTSVEKFYPEFENLLRRIRPNCEVKSLQSLKDELSSKAG